MCGYSRHQLNGLGLAQLLQPPHQQQPTLAASGGGIGGGGCGLRLRDLATALLDGPGTQLGGGHLSRAASWLPPGGMFVGGRGSCAASQLSHASVWISETSPAAHTYTCPCELLGTVLQRYIE